MRKIDADASPLAVQDSVSVKVGPICTNQFTKRISELEDEDKSFDLETFAD